MKLHTIALLFTILMAVAKICGFTTWSWLWIVLPFPIALVLEITLWAFFVSIMLLMAWVTNGKLVFKKKK